MKQFLTAALLATVAMVPFAYADDEVHGSKVVAENESCPDGMVVSGMTGGEDATTKICVSPNSEEMPHDDVDVGDPNTES